MRVRIPSPDEVEGATRQLKARIEALQANQRRGGLREARQSFLLRAYKSDPWPEALIRDPALQPVDKILWLVLALETQKDANPVRLPRLSALAERCPAKGRATLCQAMTVLRCRRWLTACSRGPATLALRGATYVLHGAPLPVRDTLFLDPGWADFLERASRHSRARHRTMALKTLRGLRTNSAD